VDVDIQTAMLENVLRIPSKAIFEKEGLQYVYVVDADKAKLVQVETGLEGEDYTEITKGLKAGITLIISPGNNVTDGAKVKTSPI